MEDFEPLQTQRLLIRKLDVKDAQIFFQYRSMPAVYRFQSFEPKNMTDVESFFCGLAEYPNMPNTWFQLAVCMKDDSGLIGDIGMHFSDDGEQAEIGYTINPDFQGKGYGLEAVSAVIKYLFTVLDKHRITASVDPENIKSIRLLEKAGMRKEAHFVRSIKMNNSWMDDCIYAILNEEFMILPENTA